MFFRGPPPPPPPPPPPASFLELLPAVPEDLSSLLPFLLVIPLAFFTFFVFEAFFVFKPLKPPAKRSKSLGHVKYSKSKLPEGIDTIVIGSGQGGLSCASVLSSFGQTVVVFEQHEVTGGGAHCFAVDGKSKWRFDAGHHITIPWQEQVLHLACGTHGAPVPFDKTATFQADGYSDRIVLGSPPEGEAPLPVRDDVQLTAELCNRFPAQAENIKRYMSVSESVQMRFGLLVMSALMPSWLRARFLASPIFGLWRKWAALTSAEGLCKLLPGTDEATNRLRSYLSGLWLDAGAPPSRCSFFMQSAVMGGWQKLGEAYPRGGPQETALAMVEAVEQRGGAVFIRCPVESILRDPLTGAAIGVKLSSGDEVRAKRVVSALGYRATEKLLYGGVPGSDLVKTKQSMSFIMANIALKGTKEDLGISAANVWVQPATAKNHYDALEGEQEFFSNPLGCDISLVPAGVTFPSLKDLEDSSAKGGEDHTCQILVGGNYEWFEEHGPSDPDFDKTGARHAPPHVARKDQSGYDALKAKWEARMVEILTAWYPKTKGKVVFCDISTPLTLENYLRAEKGAGVGLDVTPARFVDPSEIAELDMRHPRVEGLWRAGQDYLMCGQVLSAASGIFCALRMLGPVAMLRFGCRAVRMLVFGPRSRAKSVLPATAEPTPKVVKPAAAAA